jgi:deazaflavin-dependent oxidoreductase (nitroreductase family)
MGVMSVQEPIDNPTGWVNQHIRSYVDSGGRRGHRWHGADTLLLTTRGRKSGEMRRTALIYGRDGDRYVVVGSKGGSPTHPAWYLNLEAEPDVTVQVGEEILDARARLATPEERPQLWELMTGIWPDYDTYQRKTDREIPVVVIERR